MNNFDTCGFVYLGGKGCIGAFALLVDHLVLSTKFNNSEGFKNYSKNKSSMQRYNNYEVKVLNE